jgi:DNA helicase HerA-like ATPase
MGFIDDLDITDINTEELAMSIAEKMQFLSNPTGKLVRLKMRNVVDLKPGDIFIGTDRFTHAPIIWSDSELPTHYCFVGSTGSGKTCLAEDVISKLYHQQNNIFTCVIDIKGEWYESLLYKFGGKDVSHLKGRINKLERYEKGMIRNLATEDNIIIFDLSSYSFITDIVELYTQIRDFVCDIADWIQKPKGDIQLNCLFEESALWFPNTRSEFNEIFTAYDDMADETLKREKIAMDRELAERLVDIADAGERRILTQEVKLDKLNIHVDKIWSFIKEIKAMAVSSILLARSRQCSIGFLIQRASLILTTMITQVGTKFIKRQTDKNDIERIKATVGGMSWLLKDMSPNECIVVAPNYQSYCMLDHRTTHHVSENPKIKHYKSMIH